MESNIAGSNVDASNISVTAAGEVSSLVTPPTEDAEKLGSRRRRSRKACEPCRQRKRKCDGQEPCKTCVEFEYECHFASSPKRKRPVPGPERHHHYAVNASSPMQPSGRVHAHPYTPAKVEPHSPVAQDASFEQPAIYDPGKVRYMSASSAVAFPRILGLDIDRQRAPRLHSFAWHTGIRNENRLAVWSVADLIGLEDIRALSRIYFDTVHTHLGFLDQASFEQALETRWEGGGAASYDAVICGVGALGSLFTGSKEGHPQEQTMAEYAKTMLVDSPSRCSLNIDHVAGCLLRAIYLRCTSRPSGAWMATCEAMHLVEATGLHRSIPFITVVSPALPVLAPRELDYRRRLAWMAFILNTLCSYEYGRSSVYLSFDTQAPDASNNTDHFPHDVLELARLIPSDMERVNVTSESRVTALKTALENLLMVHTGTEVHVLLKVDFVLAVYRRLRLLKVATSAREVASLVDLGRSALRTVRSLVAQSRPWWNLSSTTFQLLCTYLSLDTPESLGIVPEAYETLATVKERWDTHMTREALGTAELLVDMLKQRKEKGLEALKGRPVSTELPMDTPSQVSTASNTGISAGAMAEEMTLLEWPDFSFNWDSFSQDDGMSTDGVMT